MRELCRVGVRLEARVTPARFERARKRLGVQLDAIAAHVRRPFHRLGNRVDEQAHPDAESSSCRRRSTSARRTDVSRRPSRLARDFARLHRNQRALRRANLEHELEKIGPRITLDVVLDLGRALQQLGDAVHVRRSDVTLVGARMNRNARRAGGDARRETASSTSGSLPPLELRSVATLLTLTDSFIDGIDNLMGPPIDFAADPGLRA